MAALRQANKCDDLAQSTKECALLNKLPPEVRLKIYDYHMSDVFEESIRQPITPAIKDFKKPTSPLLATCKLIREELKKPFFECCVRVLKAICSITHDMLDKYEDMLEEENRVITWEDYKEHKATTSVAMGLIKLWQLRAHKLEAELDADLERLQSDGWKF
ncbi:uncharacterized protein CLAFUR5_20355 [Fulvia fulva]|uniref:uncharacterized protein n=1 Tax=Passalora fulva TaxID=5499 RepID=UPI002852874F|nr:uncharacterized protein CLAFUR5_20355 [Fulvia fulva]WMI39062.1 hypothetical protein CLAFUR5_20355 [Fulvia fulva]